jgi:hypothetical protein
LEQPKKPGPRDITDLKARLGLNRAPAGAPPGAPPPGRAPFPGGPGGPPAPAPQPYGGQGGVPGGQARGQQGPSFGGNAPAPPGYPQQMPSGAHPAPDPYASLRPAPGRQFDLRPSEGGPPVENVRRGSFRAALVIGALMGVGGIVLGAGYGIGMSGRRAYNETNRAAKRVKTEVEVMHKTVTQMGTAVAMATQRAQAERKDRLSYDPRLIEELEKVKLEPRPDTTKIFKVDYFRLHDNVVDSLMTYYYDTLAVYGEVERFVKKTKADKASLEAFATKQAETGGAKYGVVFAGGGKIAVSNLVEMGQPVCKGGGVECPMDQLEGFQIRANAGANWSTRKVGPKPEGNTVVPLEPTPLLESVMAGSPNQARMEQYRIRYANIQLLLARIAATQKQLMESLATATARQDMFSL